MAASRYECWVLRSAARACRCRHRRRGARKGQPSRAAVTLHAHGTAAERTNETTRVMARVVAGCEVVN